MQTDYIRVLKKKTTDRNNSWENNVDGILGDVKIALRVLRCDNGRKIHGYDNIYNLLLTISSKY